MGCHHPDKAAMGAIQAHNQKQWRYSTAQRYAITAALVSAWKDLYRYELIWVKENGSDFLNANRKPLKAHESIQIFYKHQPTYNKQYVDGKPYKSENGKAS